MSLTCARLVTSTSSASAWLPLALTCAAVSLTPSSLMSAQTTLAPSRAKISAVARPMPLAGPGDDDGLAGEIVRRLRHGLSPWGVGHGAPEAARRATRGRGLRAHGRRAHGPAGGRAGGLFRDARRLALRLAALVVGLALAGRRGCGHAGLAAGGVAFLGQDVAVAVAVVHRDPRFATARLMPRWKSPSRTSKKWMRRNVPLACTLLRTNMPRI